MKSFLVLASTTAWVITATAAPAASRATVTVFAAASLAESLREIASAYQATNSVHVVFNFAASAVLATQIQAGAPADIFFSADLARMQMLVKAGHVDADTRCDRLGNSLAIVVPAQDGPVIKSARDLTAGNIRRVALGNPATVPAGTYAREYLEKAGIWEALKPKLIFTENVRAALAVVTSGNADAGIVYATDALITKAARVAVRIPPAEGPRIVYALAMLKRAKSEPVRLFFEHLCSEQSAEIFRKHGFIVLNPTTAHERR